MRAALDLDVAALARRLATVGDLLGPPGMRAVARDLAERTAVSQGLPARVQDRQALERVALLAGLTPAERPRAAREPIQVTIAGEPSAESDRAVARWLERFLEEEQPGTKWTVAPPRMTPLGEREVGRVLCEILAERHPGTQWTPKRASDG